MSLHDLSLIVEKITSGTEKLETRISKERMIERQCDEDDNSLTDDLTILFTDTIDRNLLSANLDYARKLLTQVDGAMFVGQNLRNSEEPYLGAKAILFSERKRIRNVQDKLQGLDEELEQRTDFVKSSIKYRHYQVMADNPDEESQDMTASLSPTIESDPILSAPSSDKKLDPLVPSGVPTTLEDRLQYHREQQNELADSLLKQTQILKRNALAMGEKLEKDADTVRSTMNALDTSVDNMNKTGGRLAQYRELNAIGWKFYIVSSFVMFLSVFVALIVIKLLPKW
ncbi:uncharacterized protein V1516DRAFT_331179 [Lipomyces oligophaga]|uniref:uncharacterized protein n=1 Tax=Lipomyces oligophaga TaxID=45792 RepID=UPI0034CD4E79